MCCTSPDVCNLQIERRKISVVDPTLHNSEISRVLGHRWRKLTDADRQPFIREAVRLRAKHGRDHPDYKFQPQRRRKRCVGVRQPLTVRQPDASSPPDISSEESQEATKTNASSDLCKPLCVLCLGLPGVRKWTGQSGNQRDRPENISTHYRTM